MELEPESASDISVERADSVFSRSVRVLCAGHHRHARWVCRGRIAAGRCWLVHLCALPCRAWSVDLAGDAAGRCSGAAAGCCCPAAPGGFFDEPEYTVVAGKLPEG